MRITFIIPSRNNLKYLQQAVNSITECYGNSHDIVLLDDASTDGTWDWIRSLEGEHITKYRNNGSDRVGHTILYDRGVELCKTEVFSILHADMITTPNHVENSLKHLRRGVVVSATRIEPPLHPPGPEKYVRSYGFEPEEFNKDSFQKEIILLESENKDNVTNGIFAPWMMYKEDFVSIGGHDLLFAPMELEDSDIFNRMHLAGYKLIQSRDSFVYHMTCRGSRFKDGIEIEAEIPLPDGTIWYKPKDSEEYKALRSLKFREWWRKWHTNVLHDNLMMPIVPNVYDITYVVRNCNQQLLETLEPFCDRIFVDCEVDGYIKREQTKTMFDLLDRVFQLDEENFKLEPDGIVLEIDGNSFGKTPDDIQTIQNLPIIIEDGIDEIGTYEFGNFVLHVNTLEQIPHEKILRPYFQNVF
jgi:glycosyltransferase involved in cell wall biosynthesis